MAFKTSAFRPAIIRMHENGKSMNQIAKDLGISRCAVQDAVKRFEETESNKGRPGRGRKKTSRSKKNIQRAKEMIKRNPTTKANSKRKLAKKLGVAPTQAWEMLRKDLGLKPWKYQKRQKLNAQAKQKRLDRCRAMKTRFSRGRHRQIIFSDEKIFDIQQSFNHQNDRIWAEEERDTEERAIERTQKAESVMVFAARNIQMAL